MWLLHSTDVVYLKEGMKTIEQMWMLIAPPVGEFWEFRALHSVNVN